MRATIKVRMNRTAMGAPDSVTEREYKAGEVYDVPESLAHSFFSDGAADPAEAHDPAPAENSPAPSPGHGSGADADGAGEGGSAPAPAAPAKRRKGRAA